MSRLNSGSSDRPSYDRIRRLMGEGRIHFIGIGGVSMYSLARLAHSSGCSVSGSDRERSERTDRLESLGIKVYIGHSNENIDNAALVVYSHAIGEDNPELAFAIESRIPTVNRAEYMGAVMLDYKHRIGVSGSHGKSTTVAMLDAIFYASGADPTVLSGAELSFGEPLRLGECGTLIYEACEYRDSFLRFLPSVAIALNLELDHTDYFADISAIRDSFLRALSRAENFAVISGDDINLRRIMPKISTDCITFGRGRDNTYRYEITSFKEADFEFSIYKYGTRLGDFVLKIPGVFNIHNATAAIVTALEMGVDMEVVRQAIAEFSGIPRRLQHIGNLGGRPIYYDYAHHPTEISASLAAIRGVVKGKITLLFKPHTYSRTASLWQELCGALSLADYTIITDIYAAREEPIEGVTAENLAIGVGNNAIYLPDGDAAQYILEKTEGAIVLMGAGDLTEIKRKLR